MKEIESRREHAVQHIAINRPEKKNALTGEMYDGLSDAIAQAEADREVRVLLLYSNGDSFTAGNDLKDFLELPWKDRAEPPQLHFMRAVATAKKPVVAAVQGQAVGIGTTILLHCDLIYAAEDAVFTMPFVNLGIVPEAGSTVLLPALIGKHRAAELFMLGSPLRAQRAYDIGLVNAVIPRDALLQTATQVAEQLAAKPPKALLACKELMKRALRSEVERAMNDEFQIVAERLQSPETKAALTAFLQRRPERG
jgi:enoyl-CoA hydratase/carnithine racemase